MVMLTFAYKSKGVKIRMLEDFIIANIENDAIMKNKQIYKQNLQYFLINELLKNNKYEMAIKIMEDIKKGLFTNSMQTVSKEGVKHARIEKDDSLYLHLALVYEKANTIAALDAVKKIKEKDLKEFCLFILENENFNFFDKELFGCKTNQQSLMLNKETDLLTQKDTNNQFCLLKEEVFNKKYNKYFIDFFIKQFKDTKELIEFMNENVSEKWLEELTLQNKIDFYTKTKHINLCLYFLETGFIKKPHRLSLEYKNEKVKEKIENFLEEKLKEKIAKKEKIERRITKYKYLVFPGKICTKISGKKIDLSTNDDILIMTEIKNENRRKYLKRHSNSEQIKRDYKITEE